MACAKGHTDGRLAGFRHIFRSVQLRRDLPVPPPGRTEADGWIHARRLRFRSLLEDRGRYAWCPSTLGEIFLGQAGGTTLRNYAAAIGEVYAVRRAGISLEHAPRRWFMRAGDYVLVRGGEPVRSALAVSCGIPGHDHPGDELKPRSSE